VRDIWRYAWHNSESRLIVTLHSWSDALAGLRPRVVTSWSTQDALTLTYAGLSDGLVHTLPYLELCRTRLGQPETDRRSYRIGRNTLFAGRTVAEADILAVGCAWRAAVRLPTHRSLVLPMRCHLVVRTSDSPGTPAWSISRKARQQFARERRRRGWTLEVAERPEDFDFFYHEMHIPTMLNRHGEFARSLSERSARRNLFGHGVLFFLVEDGRRVSGMLCRHDRGHRLTLRMAGTLDGGRDMYRSGTSTAMYLMILEWARNHGVVDVDLSGFEPFLSKGIFQFKRKMHPRVVVPANHFRNKSVWLRVNRDTSTVRDFLVDNPPLVLNGDRTLTAIYFYDRDRPAREDLRWQTAGISGSRLVDLDSFLGHPGHTSPLSERN
jgi:hypothetical protein